MTGPNSIIVITQARSGSNLLCGYLNQIPDVISFGEILREIDPQRVGAMKKICIIPPHQLARLDELQRTNIPVFWRTLERIMTRRKLNLAAKIFYGHADRGAAIWSVFETAKIIHLIRENILEAVVSKRLAHFTGKWVSKNYSADYDSEPIIVIRRECERHIEELQNNVDWVREKFGGRDYSEITYEGIIDIEKAAEALSSVFGFSVSIKWQSLERQRQRPLSQVVANYDEVQEFDRSFPIAQHI